MLERIGAHYVPRNPISISARKTQFGVRAVEQSIDQSVFTKSHDANIRNDRIHAPALITNGKRMNRP